ncbi:hypothetical protein [Paracoccus beibuensis]|uniref:hypothetical protein n=1 Tax=Paracoccus beibuensis TaxID=547602 RepID=UPI00224007DA|nr:hypothetical protein [Paracoccus beibuensis]
MRLFFAYLAPGESFDAATHARLDERPVRFSLSHSEGDLAGATVTIPAKPDGYIRLGRRVAISVEHLGQVHPLIVGTITAAPIGLDGEYADIDIVCRNPGWQAARDVLVESLAVAPYFDELFAQPGQARDQGAVLTGRGATIAWDRVTGLPRLNDLIDAPRTIQAGRVHHRSVVPSTEAPPLKAVEIEVGASWHQDASVYSEVAWEHGAQMSVVADEAIQEAWPAVGEEIGGGWLVDEAVLRLGSPSRRRLKNIPAQYDSALYSGDVLIHPASTARVILRNPRKQAREERVTVRVEADIQDLTEAGEEVQTIYLRDLIGEGDEIDPWQPTASYQVGEIVFYAGDLWQALEEHTGGYVFIEAQWQKLDPVQGRIAESFFATARGQAALRHAIERAKARLKYAARAVRVRFSVPLEDVLGLQIDDAVSMSDPRFAPAAGKVVDYAFEIADGHSVAHIEIACAVGRGGPEWVEPVMPAIVPPVLGPAEYPATGRVSPLADAQFAALEQAPDVYDISIRVEIDAPPVPTASRLGHSVRFEAGTISIENGVDVE